MNDPIQKAARIQHGSGFRVVLRAVFLSVAVSVLGVLAAGCDGDKPGAGVNPDAAPVTPSDLTKFVGTWDVLSASLTVTCSNDMVDVLPVTAPTIFTLGASSDLHDTGPVCPLLYDVVAQSDGVQTASALPGQTCNDSRFVSTMHFDVDTFTTKDGVGGTHLASGSLTQYNDISQGNPVRCNWVEAGTYKRAVAP